MAGRRQYSIKPTVLVSKSIVGEWGATKLLSIQTIIADLRTVLVLGKGILKALTCEMVAKTIHVFQVCFIKFMI
jgi:hypothetical protein